MSIALGYMDDDDEPLIVFSSEEKRAVPNADEALGILVPAARRCYHLLQSANPKMSATDCWTHYTRSNYATFLLSQRSDQQPVFDGSINIPKIKDTLPVLLEAYKHCRSIWGGVSVDPVIEAHAILDEIGDKMYPGCFDRDGHRGLNTFFEQLLSGGAA